MRGKQNARRAVGLGLALAVAAVAAVGAVAAGPAAAARTAAPVTWLQPIPMALAPTTTGAVPSGLWGVGPILGTTEQNLDVAATLRFDVRGLAKVAKVSFTSNCTVKDLVATCPDRIVGFSSNPGRAHALRSYMSFSALPGSKPGAVGSYTMSGTTTRGPIPVVRATVLADGPALRVAPLVPHPGLKIGSVFTEPVTFTNTGSVPSAGSAVQVFLRPGLGFVQHARNCQYRTAGGFATALCHFAGTVRPGETVALTEPIRIKVLSDALATGLGVAAFPDADPSLYTGVAATSWGTGPALAIKVLRPGRASALPASHVGVYEEILNDSARLQLTVRNTADLGVHGAKVSGASGAVVPVTVGVYNHGPATVYVPSPLGLRFAVPTGTSVVQVPDGCTPETTTQAARPTTYDCAFPTFTVLNGEHRDFTFRLRIDEVLPHAVGRVSLLQQPPFETNPGNDTAWVTVN